MRTRCMAGGWPRYASRKPRTERPTSPEPQRCRAPSRTNSNATGSPRRSLTQRPSGSALEEPHLHAGQLHDVIVVEPPRLRPDRHSIDLRIIVFLTAVHVHDEVAFGAPRNGRHLHAPTAEGGERLGEFQFASGESTPQPLQLGLG